MLTIGITLIVLSAVSKAFMDLCAHEALKSWGDWWTGHESWVNKYKTDKNGNVLLDNKGKMIPKFPLSTTILVWLTDGWHFWQKLVYDPLTWGAVIFILAMPIHWAWSCLIVSVSHKVIFELFYRIIKSTK